MSLAGATPLCAPRDSVGGVKMGLFDRMTEPALLCCHIPSCRRPLNAPTVCPTCVRPTCTACLVRGGCRHPTCPRMHEIPPGERFCPEGHPLTAGNRVSNGPGRTRCRLCWSASARRTRARRRRAAIMADLRRATSPIGIES
jgi:hypothetical protein